MGSKIVIHLCHFIQGSTKVPSGRPGQVDFEEGLLARRASARANPPSNYILSLSNK